VSPQDSTERGSLLSRINVYTVLLGIAFLALCIGCLLLALELGRYNWDTKAQKAPRAVWLQSTPALQIVYSPSMTHRLMTYKDVV
jgi:hypothetical protein